MSPLGRHLRLALTNPAWLLRALRTLQHLLREQGLLGLLARLDPQHFAAPLYRHWLRRYPLPSAPRAAPCRIALLLATEDAPAGALAASIASVLQQRHADWELWIARPAGSLPPDQENDARIRFIDTPAARSGQWNRLLQETSAAVVLPLRAGQLLHAELLAWLCVLFADTGLQAARWDSDQLDAYGRRTTPRCLPAWDAWLARSAPATTTPLALRRTLLAELGGYADDAGSACEYELALRLIERLQPGQIRHLPLLLSHRMHAPGDEAVGAAHCASLSAHCARNGIAAHIEAIDSNALQIRLAPPTPAPAVAIIMPTRDGGAHLETAVASLFERTDYAPFHLYLVDNGSRDAATLARLDAWARDPRCTVLRDPAPFNFAAINNRAIAHTREPVLCLLNDDIEIRAPHWLADLVGAALQPGVGAAGARLWYPDSGLQHAGVIMGYGGGAGHAHKGCRTHEGIAHSALLREFSAVTAACLVTRRSLFDAVGGLDAVHFPINFNDVDFCLKLREAGHRILYVPTAELLHHESVSRGADRSRAQRQRFAAEIAALRARHARWIAEDPAYNPNLTLLREDCSLAWPPRRPAWLGAPQ
jgi:GT2 family glycosyltransferase